MPESIGSKRRVLPAGVVCDKCNNYFARKVEQPVLNSTWMRNLRAWHRVPNKKDTYPSLVGRIAGTDVAVNLSRDKAGQFRFDVERKSEASALTEVIEGGFDRPVIFTVEDEVPEKAMVRFLAKMALEALAECFVHDQAGLASLVDEPFFDNIRALARVGTKSQDWPIHRRRIYPVETMMRHAVTGDWVQAGFGCSLFISRRGETLFAFCLYGMEFVINVGGPSIRGYEEWLRENDGISPLVERCGCKLVVTEGQTYLHGESKFELGVEFDKKYASRYVGTLAELHPDLVALVSANQVNSS